MTVETFPDFSMIDLFHIKESDSLRDIMHTTVNKLMQHN